MKKCLTQRPQRRPRIDLDLVLDLDLGSGLHHRGTEDTGKTRESFEPRARSPYHTITVPPYHSAPGRPQIAQIPQMKTEEPRLTLSHYHSITLSLGL